MWLLIAMQNVCIIKMDYEFILLASISVRTGVRVVGEHVCKCDVPQGLIHFTDPRQVGRSTQATHRDGYKQR